MLPRHRQVFLAAPNFRFFKEYLAYLFTAGNTYEFGELT